MIVFKIKFKNDLRKEKEINASYCYSNANQKEIRKRKRLKAEKTGAKKWGLV